MFLYTDVNVPLSSDLNVWIVFYIYFISASCLTRHVKSDYTTPTVLPRPAALLVQSTVASLSFLALAVEAIQCPKGFSVSHGNNNG